MCKDLISRLESGQALSKDEYLELILNRNDVREYAASAARRVCERYYKDEVYIRGLIEFTNICKNNCYYCGLRAGNEKCERYRLTPEEIVSCADAGYGLGFRTFVLQGGEDPFFTADIVCDVIRNIKDRHPDCAVTLSIGEKSREEYKAFKKAGADRYLLRHETANEAHYKTLHPREMSFGNRQRCIKDLKELGYQLGVGFMVSSPGQTEEDLANEMIYLRETAPDMVGIGPFIPHKDTPFADKAPGSAELTTFLLSLIRLTLPDVLLPATTALGTVDPLGREKGIMSGANVLMPNLSPSDVRGKYLLYDNKICTGDEAAACIECLKRRIEKTGRRIVVARGDRAERR
jgi:biotin synthase